MSDISKKIDSNEKLAKEAERILEDLQRNPFSAFDRIAKDIRERQDNAIAMEFTKCIGELLRKNCVVPKITEYTNESVKENSIEHRYGVTIDELDFSEHDKVFEDKIELLNRNLNLQKDKRCEVETERNYLAKRINQLKGENEELKQRISELESKETFELPFDPLECANYLINAACENSVSCLRFDCKGLTAKFNSSIYTVDDLEQIAEHLLVYCKHNKVGENNG